MASMVRRQKNGAGEGKRFGLGGVALCIMGSPPPRDTPEMAVSRLSRIGHESFPPHLPRGIPIFSIAFRGRRDGASLVQ